MWLSLWLLLRFSILEKELLLWNAYWISFIPCYLLQILCQFLLAYLSHLSHLLAAAADFLNSSITIVIDALSYLKFMIQYFITFLMYFITTMIMLLLLLSCFSHVRLCETPQTATHQAPPSLGFSRQEYWSGLPFPSPMHEVKSESEVTQSCPTLWDPMDCSLPGSSIHGIFQARVLEWDATAFSLWS